MTRTPQPLDGIKVIDLGTVMMTPIAARILADLGADVIKIESPRGDMLRFTPGNEGRPSDPHEDTTWDMDNAGKRGLALNLKTPAGKEVLMRLIDSADVFITNWRQDALARAGLDYDTLKTDHPKLVYAQASGYGLKGPDKDLPGFDFTAYLARGGVAQALAEKGQPPINSVPGFGDHQAGGYLAAGILAALYQAARTGLGDHVTTSLIAASIWAQQTLLVSSQYGVLSYPVHRRDTANPLLQSYRTSDERYIQFCAPDYNSAIGKVLGCLGRADLSEDPAYTNIHQVKLAPQVVYDMIWDSLKTKNLAEWTAIFTAADVPFAPAQLWNEVLEDEQLWANDYFHAMDYPTGATRTLVRIPFQLAEAGLPEYRHGPYLGEHSDAILAELGYSESEREAMHADGAYVTWDDVRDQWEK
ncbi:MAG: CoA transferase [Bifidobacteriaceae bacterium]|jgi:cinnamoyl-CoA:phenyllactate CoA-transferase|nr:CoA transferase [Bifidobacteriaceae bacterium]